MHRVAFAPRSRVFRYLVVGLVAFMFGSAGVIVGADVSKAPIFRISDAIDDTRIATVNGSGSLYVSQQGPITASISNTDFPDAGTHTKLDTVNSRLGQFNFDGSGNLKTAAQGTTQVSGSVTVTNFPAAAQTGVTVITLPTHTGVASGLSTGWQSVDISTCRTFSVIATALGNGVQPPGDFIISVMPSSGGVIELDVHAKTGFLTTFGGSSIGFPTWPGTNEPAYATAVWIEFVNKDASAGDLTGQVLCQH